MSFNRKRMPSLRLVVEQSLQTTAKKSEEQCKHKTKT